MTATRAIIETLVVRRCKNLMDAVSFALTYAGANDDLNDPIAWAIRKLSGTVSNPVSVSDADVASVSDSSFDALVDLAEYRTLVNIKGNYALVDISSGPERESLSQVANNLKDLIEAKLEYIKNTYGIGAPIMEAGVLSEDFATHRNDPLPTSYE